LHKNVIINKYENYYEHVFTMPTDGIPLFPKRKKGELLTTEEIEGPVRLILGSERAIMPNPCR
jgi:hypothetical protein